MRHWREWSKTTRFYAVRVVFWLLVMVPALVWLKDSIAFVIFLSVQALVESSLSGFQASRAKDEARSQKDGAE